MHEEVLVEPVGPNRFRLLRSPGLVLGVAADDVIEASETGHPIVVRRGQNLCIQIFFREEPPRLEREASLALAALGGRLDGCSANELVYTVPISAGFGAVKGTLGALVSQFPDIEWYYGNVYDPEDGVTPLNWWETES